MARDERAFPPIAIGKPMINAIRESLESQLTNKDTQRVDIAREMALLTNTDVQRCVGGTR